MRIDPDTCRDPDLLAAEVRRLRAVIDAGDTLTAEEREAITVACGDSSQWGRPHVATLTRLLMRLLERLT